MAGESAKERPGLIAAATAELPEAAPRLLVAGLAPDEVLGAVAAGVDLFDAGFVAHVCLSLFCLPSSVRVVARHGFFWCIGELLLTFHAQVKGT